MNESEKLAKEYLDAGVDLPELETLAGEKSEEPEVEEPKVDPEPEPEEKEPEEPLQETPTEQRKRSIYDEYKEKKTELKTERELREKAEAEAKELRKKLEAQADATTPQEKAAAADDLEAFAKKINADPQTLKEMRSLFLKDQAPQTNAELEKDLQEFKEWRANNAQLIETQQFEKEYADAKPTIDKLFPNASADEQQAIRTKLDELAHTKEWHDKSLDYVVFKNQETLSKLVTPRKRGLESKDAKDVATETNTDFNPDADISKMSVKQQEAWEKEYNKRTSTGSDLSRTTDGHLMM